MRKRDPGHMTTDRSAPPSSQSSNFPQSRQESLRNDYPVGRAQEKSHSTPPIPFDPEDVFRRGEIGTEEGRDFMNPVAQQIETVAYSAGETRPQEMHGCEPYPLCAYPEFMPRTAPMPVAGQDEGFYRRGVADPEMTDTVRTAGILPESVYKNDLFGPNRDGVGHNEGHPGFSAVQKKIEGEGYSAKSAGAILASKTRSASKAAHKANPRLNRVPG